MASVGHVAQKSTAPKANAAALARRPSGRKPSEGSWKRKTAAAKTAPITAG